MKVKNATLEDYVRSEKIGITNEEIADFMGSSNTRMELLRDNQTTVAGNPAWRIESMLHTSLIGDTYFATTFMIKDDKLYTFEFDSDALKVPETVPIAQKMIDSFRITTPQAPVSTPNATETKQMSECVTNEFGYVDC